MRKEGNPITVTEDDGADELVKVRVPPLGESISEVTITAWCYTVGESVSMATTLVEVSTDKVDTEIEAPISGVLVSRAAEEDAEIPVGDVIAVIDPRPAAGGGAAHE